MKPVTMHTLAQITTGNTGRH